MSGMVKKLARAFYDEQWRPHAKPTTEDVERYRRFARIAIKTLMEPNAKMREAFYREMERGSLANPYEPVFDRAWRAALDVALMERDER